MKLSQESKTILLTGATDGIGLETARKLKSLGHELIIHGRNPQKLKAVSQELSCDFFRADFSDLNEVSNMAENILEKYKRIDVLINNAGIFKTANPITKDGYDIRFVVNTFAPYLLTKKLMSILGSNGRVINLSSAAQSSVDLDALVGKKELSDFEAYAQSKLAITMWSHFMAINNEQTFIAVNPGSLLSTKMVKEGFGTSGHDINIGVDIITALALEDKYKEDSGKYFDNDAGKFSSPQADGNDKDKENTIVENIEAILSKTLDS